MKARSRRSFLGHSLQATGMLGFVLRPSPGRADETGTARRAGGKGRRFSCGRARRPMEVGRATARSRASRPWS